MARTPEDIYHFFEFNENTQAEIVWKTIDKISKLEKDLAHEIDMNAQGRAKIETIDGE